MIIYKTIQKNTDGEMNWLMYGESITSQHSKKNQMARKCSAT